MSEQEPYSIEWHKGFQMGLYSGISNERERIIKLLESFCADDPECKTMGGCGCYEAEIALIKGENK